VEFSGGNSDQNGLCTSMDPPPYDLHENGHILNSYQWETIRTCSANQRD